MSFQFGLSIYFDASYLYATDFNGVEVVQNHLSRTGRNEWATQVIITIYNCLSSIELFEEPEVSFSHFLYNRK